MENIFEKIKLINIDVILDKLNIKYKKTQGTLYLYENGKITDGWKAKISENFITDFSGKRAQGDQFGFVEKYLNGKKEALQWFKDNFIYLNDDFKRINQIDINKKFKNLNNLEKKQIDYLESRGINYEKVKKVVKLQNGGIACKIYNEKGKAININTRSIDNKIFKILPGLQSKGVYMGEINIENKKIFVVEGMFDFLSLYQFGVNVIGLKSANDGYEVVESFFKKGYKIILIPDNDKAGQNVIEKLKHIKYSLFDLKKYENIKDINEFLIESGFGEGIIEIIEEEAIEIREKKNNELAFEKLLKIQELYKKRGKRGLDGPFKEIDKYTQGIIEGKVYTIGAYSNTGKSQLAYEFASYFLKQNKKILFISTEVGTGDLLVFIARNFYRKNYFDLLSGKEEININDFDNLFLYDDIKDFSKIKELVEQIKPDYLFIDFIQSIRHIGVNEYDRITNLAIDMQELAIKTNITIFSLSQVNNDSRNSDGVDLTLKGSGSLFASSDVVFGLYRKDKTTKICIAKNKFGKTRISYNLEIDFNTGKIILIEEVYDNDLGI